MEPIKSVNLQNDTQKSKEEAIKDNIRVGKEILNFVKEKEKDDKYKSLTYSEQNKLVSNHNETFGAFKKLFPIVFEYILREKLFFKKVFKEYFDILFRKKTQSELELIYKDKRNIYYYNNKNYASYSKLLMRHIHPHLSPKALQQYYNEMLEQLDATTKENFEKYDAKIKKYDEEHNILLKEKKQELINMIKKEKVGNSKKNIT